MLEIVLWYVLPNVALFGGIFALCKLFERAVWFIIENYDAYLDGTLLERMQELRQRK